ncbi:MAG: putative molybdenum carrier protein [Gammaproteobacteria bacterium]|nr:putative molybdenum carrier protein [Gammaproteobacteria bacterium]
MTSRCTYPLEKIISGGQTGVDRAALDVALHHRFPCGGYCPKGRKAEDGTIPARYPLTEHTSADYAKRTLANVIHSHGTLIIYSQIMKGGTALTADYCSQHERPFLLLNAHCQDSAQAAGLALEFFRKFDVRCLNVAGPRHSQWAAGYRYTYHCMDRILKTCLQRNEPLSS